MNYIKRFIKNNWKIIIPVVIFFAIFLTINLLIKNKSDDIIFYKLLDQFGGLNLKSLFNLLKYRYRTWTSRLAIEFFLFIFVRFPILFRILNAFIATFLISLLVIKFNFKNVFLNSFLIILPLCVDFAIYKEVGLTSTCMNYLWPFAFCALALIVSYKALKNEDIHLSIKIISIILLVILGLWTELTALICFIFFLFSLIYYFLKNKKIDIFSVICFVLSLAFIIYAIQCPGNSARMDSGKIDIKNMSFFAKINRGVFYSFRGFFNYKNPLIYLFIIFLPCYTFLFKRNLSVKICSFVPLVIFIIYTCLYLIPNNIFSRFIYNKVTINWFSVVLMILVYFDILYVLIFSKNNYWDSSFIAICFIMSILVTMSLGFAPSINPYRSYFYIAVFQIIAISCFAKDSFNVLKIVYINN